MLVIDNERKFGDNQVGNIATPLYCPLHQFTNFVELTLLWLQYWLKGKHAIHTTADQCITVIAIYAYKLLSFGKFTTTNYLGTPIAVYLCIAILNALESLNECDKIWVKVLPMNIQYTKNLSIVLSNTTSPVCRMSSHSIIALLLYTCV